MQTANKTSAAYNFAMFETSPKKQQQQQTAKAPVMRVSRSSPAKSGRPFAVAIFCALTLAVMMMFIYNKAQISEINLRINSETAALEQAQSVNTELVAQLSGSVTLDTVEQYAASELKMQKINSSQEKYVEMSTGTMTEAAENDDDNILAAIQRWFDGIGEYLGF